MAGLRVRRPICPHDAIADAHVRCHGGERRRRADQQPGDGAILELGVAYSELNDPVIQRERLTAQSLLAAAGDPEAMELDEVFLKAMEYGMPPAGGMGMGVDRLVMLLTGAGIRETILFPLLRPESIPD